MKHPIVAILLLVMSCILIVGVAAGCEGEDEPETYRLGVMAALTGPGETYGNLSHRAMQLAMEEINEAGGINGTPLELVAEDSKCNAQDAITRLQQADGRGQHQDHSWHVVQRSYAGRRAPG